MQLVIVGDNPDFDTWLRRRRECRGDRRDEVWDGVLHVVPFPTTTHQAIESELEHALRPPAAKLGLRIFHNLGLFYEDDTPIENYRGPDIMLVDPADLTERGAERHAELVVELLSPKDESREKFPFYAKCRVPEIWLVHPKSRVTEVHVLRDGAYVQQPVRADGTIEAPRLGLTLRVTEEPRLLIAWDGGSAAV